MIYSHLMNKKYEIVCIYHHFAKLTRHGFEEEKAGLSYVVNTTAGPHYNMWDEITYPFLNFNGATVEV